MDADAGHGVMAEYAAAIAAKDATRLAALYAPDVRVFDTWAVWSFEDRGAWSRNLQDWLGALGDEGVRVEFDDVRVEQRSGTGWVSAIVTYSAVDVTGHVLRSMQNRLTWVLLDAVQRWVIVHEHTSAPIAFEGHKAILSRN